MQIHTFLDEDKLTNIVMFRDENDEIVGMITYDTCYDDRVYLLHTTSDKALAEVLQERQFERIKRDNTVLELDLSETLEYEISDEYSISPHEFTMDDWQYQLVIHKGFENEGTPDKWDDEVLTRGVNINPQLRTFAIMNNEYCAH